MTTTQSPREQRGPSRRYANDEIEVVWEPRLCIHSGNCSRRLNSVFNPEARPWVDVDGATPDEISETIVTCPTGALHFRRLDGGPQEQPQEPTTLEPRPNGPLFLRGRVRIVDADGNVVREDTRVALCRCGGSGNKPFCDGTHRTNGFQT